MPVERRCGDSHACGGRGGENLTRKARTSAAFQGGDSGAGRRKPAAGSAVAHGADDAAAAVDRTGTAASGAAIDRVSAPSQKLSRCRAYWTWRARIKKCELRRWKFSKKPLATAPQQCWRVPENCFHESNDESAATRCGLRFAPLQLIAKNLEVGFAQRLDQPQDFLRTHDAHNIRGLQHDSFLSIQRQKDRLGICQQFHFNR